MAEIERGTVYRITISEVVSDTHSVAGALCAFLKSEGFRDFNVEALRTDGTVAHSCGISVPRVHYSIRA